jgi:hypothetical protein
MTSPIHLQWNATPASRFRTGVSLHSHTLHSRESLSCIDSAAAKSRPIAAAVRISERRYHEIHGTSLELRRGWWTPPLAPFDAWSVEKSQIENLGMASLVSLTDHDDIEAPTSLQVLEQCRGVPISVEWTVPFDATFFHVGVHNLPGSQARALFAEMDQWRVAPRMDRLHGILEHLAELPETLVVLNHPLWDESGIGAARHEAIAKDFLRRHAERIHALEINGLRPWQENKHAVALAGAFGKPVISGGDRHGIEPNAVLNLTNAGSFAEFVEEVRAGWSEVLILNHYRETYLSRVIRTIAEVLRTYDDHPLGWRLWSDRIFCVGDDGVVRSLSSLFERGTPPPIAAFVGLMQFASLPRVRRFVSGAFATGEQVVL